MTIKNTLNKINNQALANPQESNAYYPSKHALSHIMKNMVKEPTKNAIKAGFLARTDGFDVDDIINGIEQQIMKAPTEAEKTNMENLLSRTLSVSDLTENTYKRFADNPNSMFNWINPLKKAIQNTNFKMPATRILRLPIELAQFIRLEYPNTSAKNKEQFNQFIFDEFKLEDDKTYFIKTGTFSSKFQFANAKCYEPREMGEYFQVINNFAMEVGAGQTIDLVVRDYIEDVENNPTIYNGMPLRTEFRAFVDFDTNQLIGIVPYWHPIVMKRVLKAGLAASIQTDYATYLSHEQKLVDEYNEYLPTVRKEIQNLIQDFDLTGQYSIDVMKNGDDLYVIDMALMSESALTELL